MWQVYAHDRFYFCEYFKDSPISCLYRWIKSLYGPFCSIVDQYARSAIFVFWPFLLWIPNSQYWVLVILWSFPNVGRWKQKTGRIRCFYLRTWWRYQMENFSALLAICAGNSPVTGEFPAQRPVTRSFDVFFDLRLNKRLSKRWWGWWFQMPSRPLWRHCNDISHHVSKYSPVHIWHVFSAMLVT